jgi:DNA-binding NarL/FixJ family response regulator
MATEKRTASPPEKLRILLVDDHPMVRERLAEVIHREPDLAVCGEAEDRFKALELVTATRPHLAIVDLTLKKSNGMELIKDLHSRHPDLTILVVSMHDESLHAERVIRAGARGYITKQEATRKIMLAIRTVLNGGIYLSEKMADDPGPACRWTSFPTANSWCSR